MLMHLRKVNLYSIGAKQSSLLFHTFYSQGSWQTSIKIGLLLKLTYINNVNSPPDFSESQTTTLVYPLLREVLLSYVVVLIGCNFIFYFKLSGKVCIIDLIIKIY